MVKITSEISQMEVRLLLSDVPEALVSPFPGCSGCRCVDVSVIQPAGFFPWFLYSNPVAGCGVTRGAVTPGHLAF